VHDLVGVAFTPEQTLRATKHRGCMQPVEFVARIVVSLQN
jgi:hypothetical protein